LRVVLAAEEQAIKAHHAEPAGQLTYVLVDDEFQGAYLPHPLYPLLLERRGGRDIERGLAPPL
jgi:hypothetical protein